MRGQNAKEISMLLAQSCVYYACSTMCFMAHVRGSGQATSAQQFACQILLGFAHKALVAYFIGMMSPAFS